jgi:hypothetical protein
MRLLFLNLDLVLICAPFCHENYLLIFEKRYLVLAALRFRYKVNMYKGIKKIKEILIACEK